MVGSQQRFFLLGWPKIRGTCRDRLHRHAFFAAATMTGKWLDFLRVTRTMLNRKVRRDMRDDSAFHLFFKL